MWIDTHCHLPSLEYGADAAISDARVAGVEFMVCVGTDVSSSRDAIALADREPDIAATAGLHPHDAKDLAAAWPQIETWARKGRVVALGETGLDFYYDYSPRGEQMRAFRMHLELAREIDLPVVVHVRDAWEACFALFDEVGAPSGTILHCFTGGVAELERALEHGCLVSFSGIITFKNAVELHAAARRCPEDSMLIETDAPYLAPVPHRGKENRPAFVSDVGRALAHLRDEAPEAVARSTAANARRVFGLAST
ncbi:MAG: TatD family hydrolase [Acidimicrobiia bacterium]